jgi:hypothetical protein
MVTRQWNRKLANIPSKTTIMAWKSYRVGIVYLIKRFGWCKALRCYHVNCHVSAWQIFV